MIGTGEVTVTLFKVTLSSDLVDSELTTFKNLNIKKYVNNDLKETNKKRKEPKLRFNRLNDPNDRIIDEGSFQ